MKYKLIIASLLLFSTTLQAQCPIKKGQKQVNFGVGLSSWGIPLYLGVDYGVHKDVTVGGELSFRSYKENYKQISYSHNIIGVSGNVNYHFNHLLAIPTKWDLYGGANLGFYVWSSSANYSGDGSSGLGLGLQIGGRYYFNEKTGINFEVGGGNSFSGGKLGLSIKL